MDRETDRQTQTYITIHPSHLILMVKHRLFQIATVVGSIIARGFFLLGIIVRFLRYFCI